MRSRLERASFHHPVPGARDKSVAVKRRPGEAKQKAAGA